MKRLVKEFGSDGDGDGSWPLETKVLLKMALISLDDALSGSKHERFAEKLSASLLLDPLTGQRQRSSTTPIPSNLIKDTLKEAILKRFHKPLTIATAPSPYLRLKSSIFSGLLLQMNLSNFL